MSDSVILTMDGGNFIVQRSSSGVILIGAYDKEGNMQQWELTDRDASAFQKRLVTCLKQTIEDVSKPYDLILSESSTTSTPTKP